MGWSKLRQLLFSTLALRLWESVVCQITDIPRDQPRLTETDVTRQCCQYLHEESNLLKCSNSSAYQDFGSSQRSIVLVSYSTQGILDYGAYSMAINTYYSQLHSYGMVLLTPEQGAQYEPRDQRWNKVKILIDALTGWAIDTDFIVWLDSDLILLDMGMRVEEIVDAFPSYDMIFSADGDIQNGIVNSGCFIVRNSRWSLAFLEKWWNSFDRVQGMDQHIFTRVWDQVPNVDEHIKILRPDALNSHLPAWVNQKDSNQILHLAGSSNVLRKLVFQKGFQQICDGIYQHIERLPRQLGLTQSQLQEFERNIPLGAVANQIYEEMKSKAGKHIPLSEIRKLYSKLLDLLQMGFERPDIKDTIIDGLKWSFDMFFNITLRNRNDRYEHLESIQMTLDSLFNLVMRMGQSNLESYNLLIRATHLIDELTESVKSEHYGPSLYYKFKHRQFLGIYLEEQGEREGALQRYKEAMQVWWEMHKLRSYGSGNGAHDPYAEGCGILYDIAALSSIQKDYTTCLESIDHIVKFYVEVWHNRSQIPFPVKKNHGMRLGIAGTCAMEMGNDDLALHYLNQALSLFQDINEFQYIRQTEALLTTLSEKKITSKSKANVHEFESSMEGDPQLGRSGSRRVYRRKKRSE